MIQTFGNRETEALWNGEVPRAFRQIADRALEKLRKVNDAIRIEEFYFPPSNRFHALSGNRAGQYAIRINQQYRVCFQFQDGNAYNVEIVDYH